MLEVGHVLGHYGNHDHAVLDKYETAAGVINEDITLADRGRFDLILSISTFEHSFDDDATGGSADKILAAIAACRSAEPTGPPRDHGAVGLQPRPGRLIECNALGEDRGWFLSPRAARMEGSGAAPGDGHAVWPAVSLCQRAFGRGI